MEGGHWGSLDLPHGLPLMPPACELPTRPLEAVVHEWGGSAVPWARVLCTGGSALANASEALRQCGWAVVMIKEQARPGRAIFGALPGPRQTAGRPERHAGLQAVRASPSVELIATDLQGFAMEGDSWRPELAGPTGRHAKLRRNLRNAVGDKTPPRFRRLPAHEAVEAVLDDSSLDPMHWVGNRWADWFAKLGVQDSLLPAGFARALEVRMHEAAARSQAFDHVCVPDEQGVRCVRCNASARTEHSKRWLDCQPRRATPLAQLQAVAAASPPAPERGPAEGATSVDLEMGSAGGQPQEQDQAPDSSLRSKVAYLLQ
ncbi:unnamed protein product, partial [Prorocentrum cordatum]